MKMEDMNIDRNDKVRDILADLPDKTPIYEYQDFAHAETTIHSLDPTTTEYCVFFNVSEKTMNHDFEETSLGRLTLFPNNNLIILKMPSEPHEAAGAWLAIHITRKLEAMGVDYDEELQISGNARFHNKEADQAFRPERLPRGRMEDWPSLVVEAGFSESHAKLRRDADYWLQESGGEVSAVITLKMARKRATITWKKLDSPARTIIVQKPRKNQRGEVRVTGGPLIIPFQDLLLRAPDNQDETDLVFTDTELINWATKIWRAFPRA